MSAVAAVVGGAALVGAAATVYSANSAKSATRDASNAAIAQQQAALEQQSQMSAPYRALGESAIPQLQTLLGIGKPGESPQATTDAQLAALRNTPGYKFQQEQGTQNTVNAASAMGLSLSGNTLEGLSKFNQGLADTTFQQAVGNYENVVGLGQASAAGQAANIGNAAANTGNILMNQGNTLAGINANEAAGITKSIGNASNQYQTLAGLSDPGGGVNFGVGINGRGADPAFNAGNSAGDLTGLPGYP